MTDIWTYDVGLRRAGRSNRAASECRAAVLVLFAFPIAKPENSYASAFFLVGHSSLHVLAAYCLLVLVAAVPASAADREPHAAVAPLRIIVPLPAGSTSDVTARMIAEVLRVELRRPVVIENRFGATGRIAVDALKSAMPDGSTILFAPIAVPVLLPLLSKDASHDPVRDLTPIGQIMTFEYAIAVDSSHPARTLSEFAAWASANRERSTYGTPSAGSIPHLIGQMFARSAGIELLHVAYRGAANAQADVMNGEIGATINALSDLVALHRAGRLRILATSGEARSALAPDVPTFGECGYATVKATGWLGAFAPAATPATVIDGLSVAISAAVRNVAVRDRLLALGLRPTGTTPQALSVIMQADIARWGNVIRTTGFTAQ